MLRQRVLILFVFIFSSIASGRTYYVSTSGMDSNDGLTMGTPWRTLAYAESKATEAGSIIALKRGDTFKITKTLFINSGGNSENPVIWDGSLWGSGEKATITTSSLWLTALINVVSCSHLKIQNIKFDPHDNNSDGIIVGGSYGQNNESFITIQDCSFYNMGGSTANIHAILVQTWSNDISNITIQRNDFNGIGGAAIFIYGGRSDSGATPAWTKNCYIGYNTITNYSREGTAECIGINNGVDSCIIEHNTSNLGDQGHGYGLVIGSNELYYGGQSGYFPKRITIRYNDFRTYEYAAVFIQGAQALSLNFFYNKLYREIKGNGGQGVIRIISDTKGATYYGAKLKFYNNTIVTDGDDCTGFADVSRVAGIGDFKNNLIVNTSSGGGGCFYSYLPNSVTHDHNSYFRSHPGNLMYAYIESPPAQYSRSDSMLFEKTSVNTDPLLRNISDFDWHLKKGSPCINAGVNVGLKVDFAGNPIIGSPDIGAYEFYSLGKNANTLNVFPNPARDVINVSFEGEMTVGTHILRITSMSGRLVAAFSMSPGLREASFPIDLVAGVYLIQVILFNVTIAVQKLVVIN